MGLFEWLGEHTVFGPGSKTAEWIDDQTFLPGDIVSSLVYIVPMAVAGYYGGKVLFSSLGGEAAATGLSSVEIDAIAADAIAKVTAGTATAAETASVADGILTAAQAGAAINLPASVKAGTALGDALISTAGYSATDLAATGGISGLLKGIASGAINLVKSAATSGLLGTVLSAGTSLYLGEQGRQAAGEAANIQARALQDALAFEREKLETTIEIGRPFREIGLEAMQNVQAALKTGLPERVPYEGSEIENFLLQKGRREAQRAYGARRIGTGTAIEEAVSRGGVSALAGREVHERERQNVLNEWLQTQINPQLALTGTGTQVALSQAGATQAAGVTGAQKISDVGVVQAGGRISGFNALVGGVSGATQAIGNYLYPDPSAEFYNYFLQRMRGT